MLRSSMLIPSSNRLLIWTATSLLCIGLFACKSNGNCKIVDTATQASGALHLIAGNIDGPGECDGVGTEAQFSNGLSSHGVDPVGMATDTAGNIYVADVANHTIRKITPEGVVTTIAGTAGLPGSADGTGPTARFHYPAGIAVDKKGNLYIAEMFNHTVRKMNPSGVVTTLAGTAGKQGSTDGIGPAARFRFPKGIAVDGPGNVYVADSWNHAIRKITPAGAVTTIAGAPGKIGHDDGVGPAARFADPRGITLDAAGNLYITQIWAHNVRKLDPAGVVTTLAGAASIMGNADGIAAAVRFDTPTGITSDAAGNLYVCDSANSTIRKITPQGAGVTFAGTAKKTGSDDGIGAAALFSSPRGIAADSAGNLYVADAGNASIRKITPAGVVTTLAGRPRRGGNIDGIGAAARFDKPNGITADTAGNLYVADFNSRTIRRISAAGTVTTLAGTPGKQGSADGIGSSALFDGPVDIIVDTAGNLYVVDGWNSTIRKINSEGVVTTFAGKAGETGSSDGPGGIARFRNPTGITADGNRNLYIADNGNNTVRKITPTGVVTTLAGSAATFWGHRDGPGWNATFWGPSKITADSAGNLYVTESHTIRKITQEGVVTTLAGAAEKIGSNDGPGSSARFYFPQGITADAAGNLYVADSGNHTIRKITPAGGVSTIAGVAKRQGILMGKLPGGLDGPLGLTVVAPKTLAITTGNSVLKLIVLE